MTLPAPSTPTDYDITAADRRDDRTRVLKHGDTFAVLDAYGDVSGGVHSEQGVYHCGTRHLSRLQLTLSGHAPLLLGSALSDTSDHLMVDLTNPDIGDDRTRWSKGTVHVRRRSFLWQGALHQRIAVGNYGRTRVRVTLTVSCDADFRDIFEVRGTKRPARGRPFPPRGLPGGVMFGYEGLDGAIRQTLVAADPQPSRAAGGRLEFDLDVEPGAAATVRLVVECEHVRDAGLSRVAFEDARAAAADEGRKRAACCPEVTTSNDLFNGWLERSRSDTYLMVSQTPHGPYPYAGIPWFSTPFGRDGILTALSMVWADPSLARGVLAYLAHMQAAEDDPARDAQPGKILHETRDGEMASLGEIPFGRYYGSVDSTPLFVLLAGRYFDRTGDLEFIRGLWPNVERALEWIERHGDADADGFVEYARQSGKGLVHQGWKDSHDAVFHADGSSAAGPIALCEVQGYVYAAKHHAAEMAEALGDARGAAQLRRDAEHLHREFERRFWCESMGTYALALDGAKRPCEVSSSNAGQVLLSGIALPQHARRVMEALTDADGSSFWGVRTIRAGSPRYNPMSYHNGSIWPHDTALVAAGFARYGFMDAVVRLVEGMFAASLHFEQQRLPELFCGFDRHVGHGPTRYPVACAPQAWAAASAYLFLAAMLGLEVDGRRARIRLRQPRLPASIDWLRVTGLQVGEARVDLLCERRGRDVAVSAETTQGRVGVVTER